jgi:3-deoxy-7-phosphoheptulonate synthase
MKLFVPLNTLSIRNINPLPFFFDIMSEELKLVNLADKKNTIIDVKGVNIGSGMPFVVMAGPCAVENEKTLMDTASHIAKSEKAHILRGGAFKPRSSPYSFQGLGEEALKLLKKASEKYKMPIVTECMEISQIKLIEKYADIIQVGARNMQNFELLKALGKSKLPIMLKRGLSATVDEWLASAEYIMKEGNHKVILCERGIRSFDSKYTRNVLDLSVVPILKKLTHLPIIIDPSHAAGRRDIIIPLCKAAKSVGADGVIVEVNSDCEHALCDGKQSLTLDMFDELVDSL